MSQLQITTRRLAHWSTKYKTRKLTLSKILWDVSFELHCIHVHVAQWKPSVFARLYHKNERYLFFAVSQNSNGFPTGALYFLNSLPEPLLERETRHSLPTISILHSVMVRVPSNTAYHPTSILPLSKTCLKILHHAQPYEFQNRSST